MSSPHPERISDEQAAKHVKYGETTLNLLDALVEMAQAEVNDGATEEQRDEANADLTQYGVCARAIRGLLDVVRQQRRSQERAGTAAETQIRSATGGALCRSICLMPRYKSGGYGAMVECETGKWIDVDDVLNFIERETRDWTDVGPTKSQPPSPEPPAPQAEPCACLMFRAECTCGQPPAGAQPAQDVQTIIDAALEHVDEWIKSEWKIQPEPGERDMYDDVIEHALRFALAALPKESR